MPKNKPNNHEHEATPGSTQTGFASLGLNNELLAALTALGYEEPTPIQSEAIPPLIAGRDVLGQAATGTGKTAAFSLPIINSIYSAGERGETAALILTPTRELAIQVAEAMHKYGRGLGITVLPIYGGADIRQQLRALTRGVDIVVATPGRALDHIRRKSLSLSSIRTVVLDEADEMLDMGFAEDLEAILSKVPQSRQTALFSATMAPRISTIANKHLKDPIRVSIARDTVKAGTTPRVRQVAYVVSRAHKSTTLGRVLDMESPTSTIVFCRTRTEVDELAETLKAHGYRTEALHGGMSQDQRDRVMKKFRAQNADLLIATDVAARGLDVKQLSHVVNYDVPTSPEAYVHRIGRTGRAGREGIAITLVEPREHNHLRNIERLTKQKIEVGTIPTVADLRARRLDITRASISEILASGDSALGPFRSVVKQLCDEEYNVMDIAAAAVKAAHESARSGAANAEGEIPTYSLHVQQEGGGKNRKGGKRDKGGRDSNGRGDQKAGKSWKGKSDNKGSKDNKGSSYSKSDRGDRKKSGKPDVTKKFKKGRGSRYF